MGEIQAHFLGLNLKPMHNFFPMGKTNKGLRENKALGRVSREAFHQTHIYIFGAQSCCALLHGIVTTTYFIQ
jgi:hypothetical protein